MKHFLTCLWLITVTFGPFSPAQAQDNPIVARVNAFTTAFNAGDAAAVAGFYTETGALFPPQAGNVVGRAAIAAHFGAAFQAGVTGLEVNILEIRQHGPEAAVEIGETFIQFNGQRIHGRYLHVWSRQGDGPWQLNRDIYNVIGVQ